MTEKKIGPRIKYILEQIGMQQKELSYLTGIDRAQLNRVLNGKREPETATIQKIADALHLPMDALLRDDGDTKWLKLGLELRDTGMTPEEIKRLVTLWKDTKLTT